MANYKAVANGNWSNLTTWQDDSTGSYIASTVLPGAADVVYFNNFTVAIDQDVTVLEIRNNSTTGVTAGGTGTVSTSRTINADLYYGAAGALINITATIGNIININGNMPAQSVVALNVYGIDITNGATLNFVGDIAANIHQSNGFSSFGIRAFAGAILSITGNVYAGNNGAFATGNSGIRCFGNNTISIVGNVYSSNIGRDNHGIDINNTSNNVITITGNVFGGSSGVTTSPNQGIRSTTGTNNILNIIGSAEGGVFSYAITVSSGTQVRFTGNVKNAPDGFAAIRADYFFFEGSPSQWEFRKSNLTTNTLYTPGVATGHPATNNVRTGITYGPTNNLTGTCAVPPTGSVALGVPVDNTVGTAYIEPTALAAAFFTEISSSADPLAQRMRNQATVQTTGDQIAALS
jgi:hypothetical protein